MDEMMLTDPQLTFTFHHLAIHYGHLISPKKKLNLLTLFTPFSNYFTFFMATCRQSGVVGAEKTSLVDPIKLKNGSTHLETLLLLGRRVADL